MGEDRLRIELIRFQSQRLARTYADFTKKPEYAAMATYFLERVYPAHDTSERDATFEKLHDWLKRTVGAEMTRRLGQLVELNSFSRTLDEKMAVQLRAKGIKSKFTESEYEEAYFACNNYGDRVLQIKLIVDSVTYFHGVSRIPGIGVALAVLGPYARWKGYTEGVDFLKEGYEAFNNVQDLEPFRNTVWDREVERLNRIYQSGPTDQKEKELRLLAKSLGIPDCNGQSWTELLHTIDTWV